MSVNPGSNPPPSPTPPHDEEPGRTNGVRRLSTNMRRYSEVAWSKVRQAREADGAGTTGLHRLLDVHAASVAGDAMVAVALAQTVFFNVPLGEARTRVALYLGITMLPFALLAPLVGPVLDRFRHGRRYALATTMLARGFLCWTLADQWNSWTLYPAALGILVMSRAYGVARSAAVPRLLPPQLTLVEANARGSMAGIISGAVGGGIAVALSWLGPQWSLRGAMVVFVVAMVLSLRLPPRADSQPPESVPRIFQLPGRKTQPRLFDTPIWTALVATGTLRAAYGFATLFFAFRTRIDEFFGLPSTAALAIIAGGLGVGTFLSTAIGTKLKLRQPLRLHLVGVIATGAMCGLAALWYGLLTATLLTFVIALSCGLCKLGVDALIQRRVHEEHRSSAFAHSETFLQLAWVAGGIVGLIPVSGPVGLTLATAGCAVALVRVMLWLKTIRGAPAQHQRPARHATSQAHSPAPDQNPVSDG